MGRNVAASEDRLSENYRTFTAALSVVETRYVDKVESDRLVYGAISGMLQTLDPHSNFMDPKAYAQLRERQEGRYYGLGITISAVDGDITVVSLFEGSPAYKQGIRRGDIIAKIDGEDAKGWTTDQAVRKLRGPKGTTVDGILKRPGNEGLFKVEVDARRNQHPDDTRRVHARRADRLHPPAGLRREHRSRSRPRAAAICHDKGMKRLLLDIRGNPGGPARSGDPRGQSLPEEGRPDRLHAWARAELRRRTIARRRRATTHDLPMVVLANRNSASASEIVTGALQDHDRALIVGETTFGKALVQSIYRISQGAGLALTTAHYFTPSGRLIQRPWDGTFDEYLSYTLRDQDDSRPHDAKDLKYTDSGRRVYSGGGIEPDRRLDGPIEGFNPSKFGRMLYARQLFAGFAQRFSVAGDTRPGASRQGPQVRERRLRRRPGDGGRLQEVRGDLGLKIDEAAWDTDAVFIKAMIRYDIDLALFGVAAARRHLLDLDPQAQFALSLFKEAEQLTQLSRAKAAQA